ncbi:hypothetical protein LOAG_00141 [Loa loa]|uniref:Uncharacterized protein n=1 Tax=Loa loa TaxID=7209 RepID=A0A1S0UE32_LOALO|nr:hypothetical protein LOAG_00141 [Loa loa]EFO28364.1 hypothetical protein LOAG_00141 [Loa loa]
MEVKWTSKEEQQDRKNEGNNGNWRLEYDCVENQYRKGVDLMKGWEYLVSKPENVCQVMDQTNDMAYICCKRVESKMVNCAGCLILYSSCQKIEFGQFWNSKDTSGISSGTRKAIICCYYMCTMIPPTGELKLEMTESSKVNIKIYFSGEDT